MTGLKIGDRVEVVCNVLTPGDNRDVGRKGTFVAVDSEPVMSYECGPLTHIVHMDFDGDEGDSDFEPAELSFHPSELKVISAQA